MKFDPRSINGARNGHESSDPHSDIRHAGGISIGASSAAIATGEYQWVCGRDLTALRQTGLAHRKQHLKCNGATHTHVETSLHQGFRQVKDQLGLKDLSLASLHRASSDPSKAALCRRFANIVCCVGNFEEFSRLGHDDLLLWAVLNASPLMRGDLSTHLSDRGLCISHAKQAYESLSARSARRFNFDSVYAVADKLAAPASND